MSTLTLEERLAAVETKVEEIEQRREANQSDKSDDSVPWWEHFVGIFEDNAEFEEAVRYGQKWRASEDDLTDEGAV